MKTDTNGKRKQGHLGSEECFPRGDRDTAETAPSVTHQLSQPQAEVRTNPCHWKRPDLSITSPRSAGQFTADTVSREDRHDLRSFNANDRVDEKFFHDLFSTPASPPRLSGTTTFHYTLWVAPLRDRLISEAVRWVNSQSFGKTIGFGPVSQLTHLPSHAAL